MSIYKSVRIRCNECGYEEPNDYCFKERKWIFVDDIKTNETLHFCSDFCLEYQVQQEGLSYVNKREISNNSEEYYKLINNKN